MKKLWLLLIALLMPIALAAQIPASGLVTMFASRPLGTHFNGVIFTGFTVPTLPPGATIVGIYPSVTFSTVGNTYIRFAAWGSNIIPTLNFTSGTSINIIGPSVNSTQFAYSPSIGTSLPSPNPGISIGLDASLFLNGPTDKLTILGAGYAIYYTAANPKVDRLMPPPIGVPLGQGIAWSIPTAFTTTGITDTGTATAGLGNPNPIGYAHLTGIVKIPDMVNYNGWLNIKMNRSDIKNICNSPFLAVPRRFSTYKIVDGTPIGLINDLYASQDCMSPRVPYYVEISDTNNIVQSTDNWYVPNEDGGVVDIGYMQESKFTGPIMVAIPQAIISTPIGNQTITQLPGTSLTINGTVNFSGSVGFISPIAFTTINASQINVNGATGASAPLDVNGYINASAGYLVGGSGGATGQVLVSDGQSFKPGTVAVVFPSLYYQGVAVGGVPFPARNAISFDGSVFKGTDSTSPSQTIIGMVPGPAGIAGSYTNITGITLDIYGRALAVATGTSSSVTPRTCNSNGCYRKEADGTYEMWGTSAAVGTGSNHAAVAISFPVSFTTTSNLVVTTSPDDCSNNGCSGAFIIEANPIKSSLSTSGFTAYVSSGVPQGGGGTTISGIIHVLWHAWGQ